MKIFAAKSANEAWKHLARDLLTGDESHSVESRIGSTRECLHTVLEVSDPRQRWVVARTPAINPAFALAEVVWLLAGRDDTAFLAHWFPKYPEFVGCSLHQHGAYGMRLRQRFGIDQIERAYLALRNNRSSRQVVLQIWSAADDLPDEKGQPRSSDVPCNLLSSLKVRRNRLEWLQVARSNDIDRGLPHNLVQFTMLHELMAGWLGVQLGNYVHVMDSVHWYSEHSHRLAIDDDVVPAENHDRFDQPFASSMRAFTVIANRMDRIIEARRSGLSPAVAYDNALPKAFENVFAVIAADDARRHGENDVSAELVATCDNPALRQLWDRWIERVSRPRTAVVAEVTEPVSSRTGLSHPPEHLPECSPRVHRGDLQPLVE